MASASPQGVTTRPCRFGSPPIGNASLPFAAIRGIFMHLPGRPMASASLPQVRIAQRRCGRGVILHTHLQRHSQPPKTSIASLAIHKRGREVGQDTGYPQGGALAPITVQSPALGLKTLPRANNCTISPLGIKTSPL